MENQCPIRIREASLSLFFAPLVKDGDGGTKEANRDDQSSEFFIGANLGDWEPFGSGV